MKIIAGKFKGKKLIGCINEKITRPTLSRIKEDMFNIVFNYLDFNDLFVVDLFAGSGNLGIESLSRGAKFVHFNDIDKNAISILKKNLNIFDKLNYKITKYDYLTVLNKLINEKVDLFFLDPPYENDNFIINSLKIIEEKNLLSKKGIIIFETNKDISLINFNNLVLLKQKNYKNKINIYFLKMKD